MGRSAGSKGRSWATIGSISDRISAKSSHKHIVQPDIRHATSCRVHLTWQYESTTLPSPHCLLILTQLVHSPRKGPGSCLCTSHLPDRRHQENPSWTPHWISHGRAVFALLADGMWGIWDIDGVSPTSFGAAISNRLKSGVRGAALTAFSVSGFVEGTGSLRSVVSTQKESQSRRVRTDDPTHAPSRLLRP